MGGLSKTPTAQLMGHPQPSRSEILAGMSHLCSLGCGGLLRGAVLDHLHAEHEPLAAHVADDVMLLLQRAQPLQQQTPHLGSIGLNAILVHHLQHRYRCQNLYGGAGKRATLESEGNLLQLAWEDMGSSTILRCVLFGCPWRRTGENLPPIGPFIDLACFPQKWQVEGAAAIEDLTLQAE